MRAQGITDRELRLFEQAGRQFGLLRYADLLSAGMDRSTISRWIAAYRLSRIHAGVYALGHCVLRDEGRWLAAVWACGPGAVLSHTSAAAYHRWRSEDAGDPVHVSTTGTVRSRPGIVVHRVRHLDRRDVFRPHPLTVTAMPRMVVDCADMLAWPELRSVCDQLSTLRLDKVRGAQARAPKRRGAPLVTRLLEADDAHTKSEFERRFLRFLPRHGLPKLGLLNARVAGHRADCVYENRRLVVELDGRAYHQRRAQMRADRRRDADYQLAGYRILRLVWDDLHVTEAADTAARLHLLLGL